MEETLFVQVFFMMIAKLLDDVYFMCNCVDFYEGLVPGIRQDCFKVLFLCIQDPSQLASKTSKSLVSSDFIIRDVKTSDFSKEFGSTQHMYIQDQR